VLRAARGQIRIRKSRIAERRHDDRRGDRPSGVQTIRPDGRGNQNSGRRTMIE